MRWWREGEPERWAEPEPVFRDDALRELVDSLPSRQRHMVSRVYFGGAHVTDAAAELRIDEAEARAILAKALDRLRRSLGVEM